MREILFRGCKIEYGIWLYGDLIQSNNNYYIHPQTNVVEVNIAIGKKIIMRKVDPETVGQYTGLRDRNGRRIFEGDIVKFFWLNIWSNVRNQTKQGKVIYSEEDALFTVDGYSALGVLRELEVVGNIHDNPELLEVE